MSFQELFPASLDVGTREKPPGNNQVTNVQFLIYAPARLAGVGADEDQGMCARGTKALILVSFFRFDFSIEELDELSQQPCSPGIIALIRLNVSTYDVASDQNCAQVLALVIRGHKAGPEESK